MSRKHPAPKATRKRAARRPAGPYEGFDYENLPLPNPVADFDVLPDPYFNIDILGQTLDLWKDGFAAGRKSKDLRKRAERKILEAIGEKEMNGPIIARTAKLEYEYVRHILPPMVLRGVLVKTAKGYRRNLEKNL